MVTKYVGGFGRVSAIFRWDQREVKGNNNNNNNKNLCQVSCPKMPGMKTKIRTRVKQNRAKRENGMRNEEDSLREREKEQTGIGEHRDGRRKRGPQIPPGHCVKAKCVPRKWRCETALSLFLSLPSHLHTLNTASLFLFPPSVSLLDSPVSS